MCVFNVKSVLNAHTHAHPSTHTQHLEKKKKNLPQEALSEVKLLLAFKPQGKCHVSPQ